MGASYPDINRCNFYYAPGDRRCRNPLHSPGAKFCYVHADGEGEWRARSARAAALSQGRAAFRTLLQWMFQNPLDSATAILRTQNQMILLFTAGSISTEELNSLLRLTRSMAKGIPAVNGEFVFPARLKHQPDGEKFLNAIRGPLLAAIEADRAAIAAAEAAEQPPASVTEPQNAAPGVPASHGQAGGNAIPTVEDYARNQEEFFAQVAQQQAADRAAAPARHTATVRSGEFTSPAVCPPERSEGPASALRPPERSDEPAIPAHPRLAHREALREALARVLAANLKASAKPKEKPACRS